MHNSSTPLHASSTDSITLPNSSCLSNFLQIFPLLHNHLANKMSRLGSFILDTARGSLAERLIVRLAESVASASELAARHRERREQEPEP